MVLRQKLIPHLQDVVVGSEEPVQDQFLAEHKIVLSERFALSDPHKILVAPQLASSYFS